MKDSFSLRPLLCQLALIASFWYGVPASAVDWTITDLGTLGGTESWAFGINARGQVVGGSCLSGDAVCPSFLHDGATMRDLGTLGGTSGWATGINNRGHVVGESQQYVVREVGGVQYDSLESRAFLHDGTTMRDLGALVVIEGAGGSGATGINAGGQVVGWSYTNAGDGTVMRAVMFDGAWIHDLGTLGGSSGFAAAINDSGQVVGGAETTSVGFAYHAFLYDGAAMRDLGTLGGTWSAASGINNHGQVVGWSYLSGDSAFSAFLYDGTTMLNLGTSGGTSSEATGINNRGQVVGTIVINDALGRAFLYHNGAMRDLSVLPEVVAAGWQSLGEDWLAINDSGQIVGTGMIGDQERAFRLHPQTTSRYMTTVDPITLFGLGCTQTNQSGLVILDFGRPSFDGTDYGASLFQAGGFTSISAIESAVRFFLDGYYVCGGRGFMMVAVGTSSHGSQVTSAHGAAWGQMLARLNTYISDPNLRDRLAVVGAIDIELDVPAGWATPLNARAWVDGYASTSPVSYYNYGDAQGCPTTGTGSCANGWTQEDVWYLSWGNSANPLPVPEIYFNVPPSQPTNARQWANLATLYGTPSFIPGALTQWAACTDGGGCIPPTNTPVQAWQQMMDALYTVIPDSNTVQNILYSSDITWQN